MNSRLLLDIGNTKTKWKFEGRYFALLTEDFVFDKLPKSSSVWVSNVSNRTFINKNNSIYFVESQKQYKSLINAYQDAKSLGSDRWLAMIALNELNQGRDYILIDVGTAVTIDIVNKSGIHLGGLIFPGLGKIRENFDNFPISFNKKITGVGQSTEEGWSIGTLNMVVNTINHKIRELKNELSDVAIFLTGGGYSDIKNFIDFDHDFYEHIVLDGLEFYADNVG